MFAIRCCPRQLTILLEQASRRPLQVPRQANQAQYLGSQIQETMEQSRTVRCTTNDERLREKGMKEVKEAVEAEDVAEDPASGETVGLLSRAKWLIATKKSTLSRINSEI